MEYMQTSHPTKRRKNGKLCSCPYHIRIWIEQYGEIPKGYIIHHKNGNKYDNRIENLECINRKEHALKHSKKTSAS